MNWGDGRGGKSRRGSETMESGDGKARSSGRESMDLGVGTKGGNVVMG